MDTSRYNSLSDSTVCPSWVAYTHLALETILFDHTGKRLMNLLLQEECLLWGNWVVIPHAGQSLVLQELHEAHPGAIRMKQLARTLVWWPGIDQDIENTVKSCAECQTNQSSPTETPLLPWQWSSRPWSRVHVDFMGPFMRHMILVLVDSHSKWIEAHVMSSVTSTLTIQCLRRIFATFGLPEVVFTNNGPSLVSD